MSSSSMRTQSKHFTDTIIGASSIFVGVLYSEGNIQINGVLEGEITAAQHVRIGNAGRVRAIINTISCTINGSLVGNIRANHTVLIEPSARVWGDIDAPTLQIEPGAVFKGVAHGSDEADDIFKK